MNNIYAGQAGLDPVRESIITETSDGPWVNIIAVRDEDKDMKFFEVGQQLSSHPGVDRVSFTGSDAVGARILEQAARNLTGDTLERIVQTLRSESRGRSEPN